MTSTVPQILQRAAIADRVERQLSAFLAARLPPPGAHAPERVILQPTVDLLLRGGKRLRPALCFWGWRGAGGADCEEVVAAATALELLQGCALIHDDVMDASDLRRGGPSVHRALAGTHAERRWNGPAERFGVGGAVAAGDLCLVWADQILRQSGLPAESLARAGAVYDALREETVLGQWLDLVTRAEGALRVEDAVAVARSKTAANTTAGPLRLGGALAGASPELQDAYREFGVPLGIAFQLRDDIVGAFGDPAVTGKPSGDDLRDGSCTLLLAEARRRSSPSGRQAIDALLREPSDRTVPELRSAIEQTGARTHVEELIAELGTQALEVLDTAPLADDGVREILRDFAVAVTAA
ncbi:polyprenyl synthetase family protein [Streptacidiphilus sp. EB129]|uniref:polyprenyl synthetase family protein n=1 Tax=Streptacidiphilus sp. EB129 TaxID=3156262 RepID=UPI003513FA9E